jgi:hypothetical protein
MEEQPPLGSVAIEDRRGFSQRTDFAAGVRVEKSGPTTRAGAAGAGAGRGVPWPLCSKWRSAASIIAREPSMAVS